MLPYQWELSGHLFDNLTKASDGAGSIRFELAEQANICSSGKG
jgi:hypothetical protein